MVWSPACMKRRRTRIRLFTSCIVENIIIVNTVFEMDKSFSNSLFGSSKTTGISRSRQSLGGSLFSSNIKKGALPASGKKGSGRYSLSTKSNISSLQIVARSEYNIVESYGLPLPVQVNEILTFTDKNVHVSVNYSGNGWAWAVCGRKLLVWQYKDSSKTVENYQQQSSRRAFTSQCRSLTLPHCDIGHKASLINVFIADDHQMASCLAVSPTGDVRYWPSIAHDGSSIDEQNILDGQEFEEIVSISPQNYMLVTTTCHLVQLQIQVHNGRQTIIHKVIKPPSGFLGGIGRKFASIIIGLNNHNEKESKLIRICSEKISNKEWHITILADKWLQRWSVNPTASVDQFLCEDLEVMKKIRDMYHQKYWNNRDITEIQLWLLDMQSTDRGVIILAAGLNELHTPNVIYTLVTMVSENDMMVIKEVNPIKFKGFYSKEREAECLNLKFVSNRGMAYIYNAKIIYPVLLNNVQSGEDIEKIEFHAQHDGIIAAGCHQNVPLFFSRLHGFVCITPSDFDPTEVFNSSVSSDVFNSSTAQINDTILSPSTTNVGNLLMYELDPDEIYGEDKEMINVLKAAFIYNIKRNGASCMEIIKDIAEGAELDETVIRIAQDLTEDLPAADPRWETSKKNALGSSTSMQIVQQLREKSKALVQFIEFLHAVKLWEKLGSINDRSVCHILSDTAEKIVAAIAVKCIHNVHSRIVDEAIEMTISEVNILMPTGNLTNQDVFYVQINHIHEFFKALSDLIEKYVDNEDYTTNQIQTALIEVNTILLTMVTEIMKFREQNSAIFKLPDEKIGKFEYIPWTAATGKFGLRDILLHMISCTLKYGIKTSGEPEFRQRHYTQLTELIDVILDGRKKYLDSIKNSGKYSVLFQQYESQRSDLIFPLVEGEQYELAAKVAEKYLDFQTLVVICDRTNNQQRLDEYIDRFKDMDFSQFAITWHMRQNKQGDIFSRFKGNQAALAKFLTDHPSLAWIQHVFNGELLQAAEVLYYLATEEKELITRKRIMLSLSKLCALACESDMKEQISQINKEIQLIEIQEQLPLEVLDIFGYDTKHPKVLTPEEIVDLFIAEENENSTEHEFRKALEMLQFVSDPEITRQKIWCAAILRDAWVNYNMDSPLDEMQNMMFFKLIDVCYILDEKLETFLPPVDSFLSAPQLGELAQSKSFQYLIKFGYEHIFQSYKSK